MKVTIAAATLAALLMGSANAGGYKDIVYKQDKAKIFDESQKEFIKGGDVKLINTTTTIINETAPVTPTPAAPSGGEAVPVVVPAEQTKNETVYPYVPAPSGAATADQSADYYDQVDNYTYYDKEDVSYDYPVRDYYNW